MHIRKIIEIKLKNSGYKTLTAKNGEEGLEIIIHQKPDGVISDLNMPKLDGKQLSQMTNPLKKDRPFLTILITARINPDEQQWIKDLEDTWFMEKPFSPSKIVDIINQYFAEKRL